MHNKRNLAMARQRVGSTLDGRFLLEELLGMGGAASVYRARVLDDDAQVAVKLLHHDLADSARLRTRFEREADISLTLEHPNILRVFEHSTSAMGDIYLVMELLNGVNLRDFLRNSGGKLDVPKALDFTAQILSGLAATHSIDVIHRDLKPDNIFVTRSFEIKLFDFGVARLQSSSDQLTQQGSVLGTPAYMAPEQARGRLELIDARTDIFALGATIYHMLTGEPVRKGVNAEESLIKAATKPPESIARLMPDLPTALVAIIDKSLSYNPSRRYQSAAEMLADLEPLLDPDAVAAAPLVTEAEAELDRALNDYVPSEHDQTAEDVSALVETLSKGFGQIERALDFMRKYSNDHAEAINQFELAYDLASTAITTAPEAVELRVRPYSLNFGDHSVWEPGAPFDSIPYNLFSSGIRAITLRPGLGADEFRELLEVITLDPRSDLPPEDDLATVLWQRALAHVSLRLVSTFRLDNPEEQEAFLRDCAAEQAATSGVVGPAIEARLERTRMLLTLGRDALAEARGMSHGADARASDGGVLLIPMDALELLSEARANQRDNWSFKLPYVLAEAFVEADRAGDADLLTLPLTDLVARYVRSGKPDALLALYHNLCARLTDANTRTALTREIFSTEMIADLFTQVTTAARDPERRDTILSARMLRGLQLLVTSLGPEHGEAAASAFAESMGIKPLVQIFFAYLREHAAGNERHIGPLLSIMPHSYCDHIANVLAALDTNAGWGAISYADMNPDSRVRLAMLERRAEHAAYGVEDSVATIATSETPETRIRALQTAQRHKVPNLAPFLIERATEPGFFELPYSERRLVLTLLHGADRAEAHRVALSILKDHGIGLSDHRASTRMIAVELLSDARPSSDLLEAMSGATKRRPWNPKELREAAQAALTRLQSGGRA